MTNKNFSWLAVAAFVALLAVPATAQATLTYVRNPLHPAVYVAQDNGKQARKIGNGYSPKLLPDGEAVAYLHEGSGHKQELKLAPVAGGASRTLMVNWRDPFYIAFSPDSTMIAALRGPEIGKLKLVLIDVESGAQLTVARGYFNGFSFSPEGDELVYGKAPSENYPPRSDIYRYAIVSGKTSRLTGDHRSLDPLWGPTGRIVFAKQLGAKKRKYGPKNELYLMNPNGKKVKRLTHTKVGPLLQGLYPTEWSANGARLLAEFGGQDTSYAVAVNAKTGAQHPVVKGGEMTFVGTALSANGKTVLGFTGGFEPGPKHAVATAPFSGGKPKTLVKNAYEPDWTR